MTFPPKNKELAPIIEALKDADAGTAESVLNVQSAEGQSEKLVDTIEMMGEEVSAGFQPGANLVPPAMRYLHSSRTIHQLVTDRNRAVGIYLAVASLLLTASGAIFNANPRGEQIIPFALVQKWCLPVTFAVLTVLSVFIAFLLVRTRVGLIYEVAKMNALLGLPVGRVSRISPLSIFFLMQAMVSTAGGFTAGLFTVYLMYYYHPNIEYASIYGAIVAVAVTLVQLVTYMATVCWITRGKRLEEMRSRW